MYSGVSYFLLITEVRNQHCVSNAQSSGASRVPRATGLCTCHAWTRNSVIGSGFPHSDIRGSKLLRSSSRLFAAQHVLHRLSAPRHPPNALSSLDRSHYQCPFRTRQHGSGAGLLRAAPAWSLIRKTSLQDRTDGPLRSSTEPTKHISGDPLAGIDTNVPGARIESGLRPQSTLGTIFSSRCQISRAAAVPASL